jgi:hypothetical protein
LPDHERIEPEKAAMTDHARITRLELIAGIGPDGVPHDPVEREDVGRVMELLADGLPLTNAIWKANSERYEAARALGREWVPPLMPVASTPFGSDLDTPKGC